VWFFFLLIIWDRGSIYKILNPDTTTKKDKLNSTQQNYSSSCVAFDFVSCCGVWFRVLLKDRLQSITKLIIDLGVNVVDPEVWVFQWLIFYHIICRYFTAINLFAVSLFADSSFTFLTIFLHMMWWMNIYFF